MDLYQHELETPLGVVCVISDAAHLRVVEFADHQSRMQRHLARRCGRYVLHAARGTSDAVSRLTDYFAGDIGAVDGIAVATAGTPFQQKVWAALRAIPAGTAVSYGTIASRIGRPTAFRAVGLANGSNPIAIVVPCHRVIGNDKSLTGYGGGIERKQWLLAHEGVVLADDSRRPGRDNAAKSRQLVMPEAAFA